MEDKLLDAITELRVEFIEHRAQSQTEHKHQNHLIDRNYTELAKQVDENKVSIKELTEQSVEIKTKHDAEIGTAKMFGQVGLGAIALFTLVATTIGVIAYFL